MISILLLLNLTPVKAARPQIWGKKVFRMVCPLTLQLLLVLINRPRRMARWVGIDTL